MDATCPSPERANQPFAGTAQFSVEMQIRNEQPQGDPSRARRPDDVQNFVHGQGPRLGTAAFAYRYGRRQRFTHLNILHIIPQNTKRFGRNKIVVQPAYIYWQIQTGVTGPQGQEHGFSFVSVFNFGNFIIIKRPGDKTNIYTFSQTFFGRFIYQIIIKNPVPVSICFFIIAKQVCRQELFILIDPGKISHEIRRDPAFFSCGQGPGDNIDNKYISVKIGSLFNHIRPPANI